MTTTSPYFATLDSAVSLGLLTQAQADAILEGAASAPVLISVGGEGKVEAAARLATALLDELHIEPAFVLDPGGWFDTFTMVGLDSPPTLRWPQLSQQADLRLDLLVAGLGFVAPERPIMLAGGIVEPRQIAGWLRAAELGVLVTSDVPAAMVEDIAINSGVSVVYVAMEPTNHQGREIITVGAVTRFPNSGAAA